MSTINEDFRAEVTIGSLIGKARVKCSGNRNAPIPATSRPSGGLLEQTKYVITYDVAALSQFAKEIARLKLLPKSSRPEGEAITFKGISGSPVCSKEIEGKPQTLFVKAVEDTDEELKITVENLDLG